ncbi:MAG: hypothetical protein ACFE78_04960 [Candidatus Hodarchaeota archaeon]
MQKSHMRKMEKEITNREKIDNILKILSFNKITIRFYYRFVEIMNLM